MDLFTPGTESQRTLTYLSLGEVHSTVSAPSADSVPGLNPGQWSGDINGGEVQRRDGRQVSKMASQRRDFDAVLHNQSPSRDPLGGVYRNRSFLARMVYDPRHPVNPRETSLLRNGGRDEPKRIGERHGGPDRVSAGARCACQ